MLNQPLFQFDENFPGIERENWWDNPPVVKSRDGDFILIDKRWVLDKATRHCMSLDYYNEYRWDSARGWSSDVNGIPRNLTEEEFVHMVRSTNEDYIWVWSLDGFWTIKI
jgi:hypothetical protein